MDNFGFLKVAAAVPHVRVADCDYNTERMAAMAEEAARRGVEIVAFPELGVTAYTCGDLLLQQTLLDAADEALERLVRATRKLPLTLIAGAPLRHGSTLYNCAVVFTQGKVLGVVPKTYIPDYGEFYENRWFASGAGISDEHIAVAGQQADFGADLTFEVNGAEFGIEICEDLWTAAPPSSQLALNGAKAPNGNRDSETNLGDLITDAMLWKIRSDATIKVPVENVVAITNGGGIRATVKAGDITKKDINTVLPFGNTLAVVYVTGAELLEALEASTFCTPESLGGFPQAAGVTFMVKTYEKYDANPDPYPKSTYYGPKSIQRVTIDNVNGKAFDPTATYAVVTNNFVAGGGDTYHAFAAATDQFDTGLPLDEVVMEYITKELKGVIGEEYALPGDRIVRAASAEELEARGTFLENMSLLCDLTAYTEDSVKGVKAAYAAYKAAKTTEAVEAATADLLKAMPELVFVPNTFTDAQSGWYKAAVDFAQASGLMNGMTATEFAPNVTTTRAMVAQVLYRLAGSPTVERTGAFADVAPGAWYYDAMLWASSTGILKGYEDGTYRPARAVSRQEMATILLRMADVKLGADLVDAALAEIADGDSVASWARAGVAFCYLGGIMNGMDATHFAPTGMLTRAQLAQVFFNLYNIGMDEVMNSGEDPEPASSLLAA